MFRGALVRPSELAASRARGATWSRVTRAKGATRVAFSRASRCRDFGSKFVALPVVPLLNFSCRRRRRRRSKDAPHSDYNQLDCSTSARARRWP